MTRKQQLGASPEISFRGSQTPEEHHARPSPRSSALALSFDFEDWHQLVGRRLGIEAERLPGHALARATGAILDLLDELHVKATFFILGMSAEACPAVVREIAARGHECASHGYGHVRPSAESRAQFRADLKRSIDVIERLSGQRPIGYRAPGFSITSESLWVYDELVELGFRYDSSQCDTPRVKHRIGSIPTGAFRLELASGRNLWEFPIAVWRTGHCVLPIGGGGYWRLYPARFLLNGLHSVAGCGAYPVIYSHPYECDPKPLRIDLPDAISLRQRTAAIWRTMYRETGRTRTPALLRRISGDFPLVTLEDCYARLDQLELAGQRALSPQGALV